MGFDVKGWLRQPSTILGIGTFSGVVAAALAHYAGGDVTIDGAAGAVVFGAVHLIMPDNSRAAADAQALAVDVIKGAATHQLDVELPAMMRDALALVTDFAKPVTVTAAVGNLPPEAFAKGSAPASDAAPVQDNGALAAGIAGGAIARTLGTVLVVGGLGAGLMACSVASLQQAAASPAGQLFCAIQTGGGDAFVAGLIDAEASKIGAGPIAVLATGAAKKYVDDACNKAGGVAVSPPADPAMAPQIAVVTNPDLGASPLPLAPAPNTSLAPAAVTPAAVVPAPAAS